MSDSRILGALQRLVAQWTRALQFASGSPCRVVAQDADGTLHLQPDDASKPACQGIPIRHGIPGVTGVTVAPGTRVRLCYDAADPGRPYAALWDLGQALTITITAAGITLTGGTVNLGGSSLTALQGVVNGQAIDTLTGVTQFALGNASTVVLAAKS